jgi:O-antigen biosynthesis protein
MIEERYYDSIPIDSTNRKTSWTQMVRLIGGGRRVLDVGSYKGRLAEILKANSNTVVGMELNPEWAKCAEAFCEEVICGDVEDENTLNRVGGTFDAIVLGDVLEHLRDPWTLLDRLRRKLNPGGFIVCSLPNIANWKPRLKLLLGRFDYDTNSVLLFAHLRFFTRASAERMFGEANLEIKYFGVTANRMPLILAKLFPTLFAVQFVYKLYPR